MIRGMYRRALRQGFRVHLRAKRRRILLRRCKLRPCVPPYPRRKQNNKTATTLWRYGVLKKIYAVTDRMYRSGEIAACERRPSA